MAAFWRLAAAGVALVVATSPVFAASPDPASLRVSPEETARARALVRQLGSDIFQERDGATRDLAAMGRRALVALDEARGDADPEVAARVRSLYPRAALDEVGARVASFLADAEGRYGHDIPGWPKFRAALGDDAASRELFAEVAADKDNHELLAALGGAPAALTPALTALAGGPATLRLDSGPPDAVRRALAARWQQLLVTPPTAPRPDGIREMPIPVFTLLLLAGSHAPEPEVTNNGNVHSTAYGTFANTRSVIAAVAGGHKHSGALRQLTWLWLETRPDPAGPALSLSLGQHLKLDPARLAALAARALAQPTFQPHQRVAPIATIGQAKARGHLGALAVAFTDERPLIRQAAAGGFDILLCDYALVVALDLTGQRPEDYGLALSAPLKEAPRPWNYMTYHFRTDPKATAGQKRLAAFDRWRAFEAAQLGSVLGGPLADRVTAARLPRGAAKPDPKPLAVDD